MPHLKQAKMHIYAGDGKGKSTAATGLAVRAAGRDFHVRFYQFLKSGKSAELKILRSLPTVEVVSGMTYSKFTFQMSPEEKEITRQELSERLESAFQDLEAVDLLILDEALGALSTGLLSEERLIELAKARPAHVELILTGRGPSERLVELTDYYSEVCMRKHPYETEQLDARAGIEF